MCFGSPKSKSRKSKSKRSNKSSVSSSAPTSPILAPRFIVSDAPGLILSNRKGTRSIALPASISGPTIPTILPRTLHNYQVKAINSGSTYGATLGYEPGLGYGYGALQHHNLHYLPPPAGVAVYDHHSGALSPWGWHPKPDGNVAASSEGSQSSTGQTNSKPTSRAVNEAGAEELVREVETARKLAERLDEVGELRGGRTLREFEREREREREREWSRDQQREREQDVTAKIALDLARRNEMELERERYRRERQREQTRETDRINRLSGVVASALAAERERDSREVLQANNRELARLGSGGVTGGVNVYLPAPTCAADTGRERRRSSGGSLGIPVSVARRMVERLGHLEGKVWDLGMEREREREREEERWFQRRVGMERREGIRGW